MKKKDSKEFTILINHTTILSKKLLKLDIYSRFKKKKG